MKMNKSIVALAVSGGIAGLPMAASAAPEVYGMVDIGIESYNADTGAQFGEFNIFAGFNGASSTGPGTGGRFTNSDDRDASLNNGMQSRLGVRGSEDLGNGLTAEYNVELAIDVLGEAGGTANTGSVGTRLGWVGLAGDWGSFRVGTQWQPLFAYTAWNVHRADTHAYGTYFSATGAFAASGHSMAYGFREAGTLQYQYGSGGYGTDPFTFTISLGTDQNSSPEVPTGETEGFVDDTGTAMTRAVTASEDNENFITSVQIFAAGTFADGLVTINGGYAGLLNEFDTAEENEPELLTIGGRVRPMEGLLIGFNWIQSDSDGAIRPFGTVTGNDPDDDTETDTFNIMGQYDFGGGLVGHIGFGTQSADDGITEIDSAIYGDLRQNLSDRTNVRLEFEHLSYDENDGGGFDDEESVVMVALQHWF